MGNDLKLRPWSETDCRLLYDWRMDESNRRWFGDPSQFSFSQHKQWFMRIMSDKKSYCYILENEDTPLAQIRFDPDELPGNYKIAVSTAPGMTGKGFGFSALKLACQRNELLKNARLFISETLVENIPSQKIFVRQGFIRTGESIRNGKTFYCWTMPVSLRPTDPICFQLFASIDQVVELEAYLAKTGLAQMTDDSALVKIFIDSMTNETLDDRSMVFHLNTTGSECILDLALRFPRRLRLPIAFCNGNIAVAQIMAAVKLMIGADR